MLLHKKKFNILENIMKYIFLENLFFITENNFKKKFQELLSRDVDSEWIRIKKNHSVCTYLNFNLSKLSQLLFGCKYSCYCSCFRLLL